MLIYYCIVPIETVGGGGGGGSLSRRLNGHRFLFFVFLVLWSSVMDEPVSVCRVLSTPGTGIRVWGCPAS